MSKQCGFLSRTLFGGLVGCVKQTRSVHEAWLDEACGNGGQFAAIRLPFPREILERTPPQPHLLRDSKFSAPTATSYICCSSMYMTNRTSYKGLVAPFKDIRTSRDHSSIVIHRLPNTSGFTLLSDEDEITSPSSDLSSF